MESLRFQLEGIEREVEATRTMALSSNEAVKRAARGNLQKTELEQGQRLGDLKRQIQIQWLEHRRPAKGGGGGGATTVINNTFTIASGAQANLVGVGSTMTGSTVNATFGK